MLLAISAKILILNNRKLIKGFIMVKLHCSRLRIKMLYWSYDLRKYQKNEKTNRRMSYWPTKVEFTMGKLLVMLFIIACYWFDDISVQKQPPEVLYTKRCYFPKLFFVSTLLQLYFTLRPATILKKTAKQIFSLKFS